jgi:hypothetical protein
LRVFRFFVCSLVVTPTSAPGCSAVNTEEYPGVADSARGGALAAAEVPMSLRELVHRAWLHLKTNRNEIFACESDACLLPRLFSRSALVHR